MKEDIQEIYMSKKVDNKIVKLQTIKTGAGVVDFRHVYKNPIPKDERIKIKSSADCFKYLQGVYNPDELELRESFYAVYLNRQNEVLGSYLIGVGSVAACVVPIAAVVRGALLCNASGVILSHNHPSGQLLPSENDNTTTKNIKKALQICEINLLDHIIVGGSGSYYSFTDEGIL